MYKIYTLNATYSEISHFPQSSHYQDKVLLSTQPYSPHISQQALTETCYLPEFILVRSQTITPPLLKIWLCATSAITLNSVVSTTFTVQLPP
jgi:hypothetical protein